jgi:Xaa-Pro aminopeptidase
MAEGTFGTMATDREERVNFPRMREYRLNRAKKVLEQMGIGCLVTWDAWAIRYISSVYVTIPVRWAEGQFCILPRNGDPYVHAVTSFSHHVMREEMPWLKNKIFPSLGIMGKMYETPADCQRIVDRVGEIIAEHGLTKEPVALDCSTNLLLYQEAFKKKGITVVDGKKAMFEARRIKNQDEIECMRISAAIAEAAFADIQAAIKPGVKECELVGIGMKTLYSLGCDETMEFVCASGPRTNPLHIDYTDRMVRPGDLVVVDINGSSYQGYKACYYRTFCCGKATQEQKDIYHETHRMMYAGIKAVKAGNTTWDITKNWPDSPKYWGYDTWDEVFGYAVGHGLGLSLHDTPFIFYPVSKANPIKLDEGMCIALETWCGKRGGKDGVRLEEVVAVTKDGYDLLTHYPVADLIEVDY